MESAKREQSLPICEMMERLGIDRGAGILPRLSLRYMTAFRRCEACPAKKACKDWLDRASGSVTFAPHFCVNADILFELKCDEVGPRGSL